MERRPPREWLRELLLTTGAVIGAICLLAAVGSVTFGLQPLIFRSGSMEPAIGTGRWRWPATYRPRPCRSGTW